MLELMGINRPAGQTKSAVLSLLFVILFYGPGHLFICFYDKSPNIVTFFAVVELACVPSRLKVQLKAAADWADLLNLFGLHKLNFGA